MGPLPPTGQWVRLEVPASQVGLEGITVIGAGFNLYNGSATWNHSGMRDSSGNETVWIGDSLPTGAEPFTNNDTWTWTQSGLQSDFQYAGYYTHVPSTLNLTLYRAYDPNTARWLSRDPYVDKDGNDAELILGPNLYTYVRNSPINGIDGLGLVDDIGAPGLDESGIGGSFGGGGDTGGGEGYGPVGNGGGEAEPEPAPPKPAPASPNLPSDARSALNDIEGGVPRPNVRAPKPFANDGRGGTAQLPCHTAAGQPIKYTEYTVNPRPPGGTLDAKRIVIGNDGSIYYTGDHFSTFVQVK
jgi:RHS repeat-associated protein